MKKGRSGSWPVGCSALHNLQVKLASPFIPIVPILPILQANRSFQRMSTGFLRWAISCHKSGALRQPGHAGGAYPPEVVSI